MNKNYSKLMGSFVSLLMIFAFPMGQAHASQLSVGDAMSELQYNLTVQWDQKDEVAKAQYYKDFEQKIETLRKQGLTDEALLEAVAAETGNPQSAKDLKTLASYAKDHALSPDQINDLVSKYAVQSEHTGAHWKGKGGYGEGGGGGVFIAIGIIVVIIVVIVIVRNNQNNNNGNTDNNNNNNNGNGNHCCAQGEVWNGTCCEPIRVVR